MVKFETHTLIAHVGYHCLCSIQGHFKVILCIPLKMASKWKMIGCRLKQTEIGSEGH